MEDAAIHETDLGDGNSLFGVFDGHGGTTKFTQVIKSANMFLTNLQNNSLVLHSIKTKITLQHLIKHLELWIR